MADTYWLSFRLKDTGQYAATYADRYDELVGEIKEATNGNMWWYETSSFFLFASNENIDQIVARVKTAIDTSVDIAVIGKTDYKTGRLVGASDDPDIFKLVPFMKKV